MFRYERSGKNPAERASRTERDLGREEKERGDDEAEKGPREGEEGMRGHLKYPTQQLQILHEAPLRHEQEDAADSMAAARWSDRYSVLAALFVDHIEPGLHMYSVGAIVLGKRKAAAGGRVIHGLLSAGILLLHHTSVSDDPRLSGRLSGVGNSSASHGAALPAHQLTSGPGIGVYSGTYPKSQGYYNTCSSDATALYSRAPLDPKDGAASVGTSHTPGYYPYEYALGQYPYDRYGYSSSDGASRRKNATRETTSTLKAWLQEHQKNPYPTKGEKIMLAIITRMTLTQVSTWFANARRRLKKENKVTWSPRPCKSSDDRGCDEDSDEAEKPLKSDKDLPDQPCADLQSDLEDFDLLESDGSDCEPKPQFLREDSDANPNTELSHGHLAHNPDNTRHGKDRLSPDCPQTVQQQNNTFYANPDPRSTESKPKTGPSLTLLRHWTAACSQNTPPACCCRPGPCLLGIHQTWRSPRQRGNRSRQSPRSENGWTEFSTVLLSSSPNQLMCGKA
ncbi:hypothetical protein F7725_024901 [Dissostichus mawsoni]|uniref:Homeobox domain-containing protein n=1 Tax=Dissostichus mawsoni TaxID=36200 RepID=A0A7J5XAP9_DISMA|nr:hypothetical protein F7725_024901 [Dissostichus mawsoni]